MTPKLDCSIMYAPAECLPDNSVMLLNEMHPYDKLGFTNPDGGVTLDRSIHSSSLQRLTVHVQVMGTFKLANVVT